MPTSGHRSKSIIYRNKVSDFLDFMEQKGKLILGIIIDNLVASAYNVGMIQTSPRLSMMRTMAGSFF